MSTYWGYECGSHEPPIESEHWFNHGEHVLREVFTKVRGGTWPDREDVAWEAQPAPVNHRGYITSEPVDWLRAHPHCKVSLRNEYGDRVPL